MPEPSPRYSIIERNSELRINSKEFEGKQSIGKITKADG
jgi:hypothetical protein